MPYFVLFALPSAIIVLSLIAIFSTTRYYTAWLRRVALVAKIENVLGIDSQVKLGNNQPEKLMCKKDQTFMDNYYLDSRKKFESSEEFINKNKWKGDNKWAISTFLAFAILGVILIVFHTYILYFCTYA